MDPGDPCVVGARDILVERDHWGDPIRVLTCAVPLGAECGSPVEAVWRLADVSSVGAIASIPICGCDGRSHWAWFDSNDEGPILQAPLRWFGACEDPCAAIGYDPDLEEFGYEVWGTNHDGDLLMPAAPECTRADGSALADHTWTGRVRGLATYACWEACLEAFMTPDGRCVTPLGEIPGCCPSCRGARYEPDYTPCLAADGITVAPEECCYCGDARPTPDGGCAEGDRDVADGCCDCSVADDRACDDPLGPVRVSDACCDCSNATLAADGSCVDGASGMVIAPFCCGA
ncbi:MAG: hypothetical protein KC619_05340 [Myxococcales bacterium]|nr:hypothetical protein [Myxococcales bacterium]